MFNPQARVRALPLFDGRECLVIDDLLADPQAWVDTASRARDAFVRPTQPYPGLEAVLPDAVQASLADHFASQVRARLGGRRTLGVRARLSLATLKPHELEPRQWFCHRDSAGLPPDQCIVASVLYLFHDEGLGGTSFYRPRRSDAETVRLVHDAGALSRADFEARYPEIAPGYQLDGNAWFDRVASVPARWNRAIFYDGSTFHSADLAAPDRLVADPVRGRLTVNGFFTCRRTADR